MGVPPSLQRGPVSTLLLLLLSWAPEWELCLPVLGDVRGCVAAPCGTGLSSPLETPRPIPAGLLPLHLIASPLPLTFSSHTSLPAILHMCQPHPHLLPFALVPLPARFLPQTSVWLVLSLASGLISSVGVL